MPDLLKRPYEDHRRALERAKTAGDSSAVQRIRGLLQNYPEYHQAALDRAEEAGNPQAVEELSGRYFETKGDYKGKDLESDPVFQRYSRRLYQHLNQKPFEGSDEEAGKYGLKFRRGLDSSDVDLGSQIVRMVRGDVSDDEKHTLRILDKGYNKAGMSMEGFLAHAWNTVNPLESPTTYIGLGVGGLAAKGTAKAAGKVAGKQLLKRAATGAGKKFAREAGEELAERGVRTVGGSMLRGGAAGALEGAAYAAAHDVGQQSFQEDEYDVGRGLAAAGTGAVAGGALGAVVAPLVGRGGRGLRQAKETIEAMEVAPPGAAQRVMRSVLKRGDDTGELVQRAAAGDLAGAYKDMIAARGPLKVDELMDVFEDASTEAMRDFKVILKETRQIARKHGVGTEMIQEAMDAARVAKKQGVKPGQIGADLVDHPSWRKLPRGVQEKMAANARMMQEAVDEASDIVEFANKTFKAETGVDKILSMPAVDLTTDYLPRMRLLQEATGKARKAFKRRAVPRQFNKAMARVADLDPDMAPGLASKATVRKVLAGRGKVQELDDFAREAGINVDVGKWAPTKKSARAKDFGKLRRVVQEHKAALETAKAMGTDATTKTSPGGIQAQLAIERKLSKPEVIKGLNKMNDEVREGIEKLGAHLDEAKRSGTPEQVRAIKEQLNQWRKKGAYLRRFREHYVLNLDTDKFLTGRKGSSEDLYYKIQDALAQRAKPMSDAEYRSFLERGLGRRGSGGFGVSQRERAKEILEDTAFNLRANAEVVAEKKSRAGKLKIKAKTKQEEELVQQAQREARIRKVLSE